MLQLMSCKCGLTQNASTQELQHVYEHMNPFLIMLKVFTFLYKEFPSSQAASLLLGCVRSSTSKIRATEPKHFGILSI